MSALTDENVPNIGPHGIRRRRLGGILWLVVGIVAAALLAWHDAGLVLYCTLFLPFTMAAGSFLQARERT